jgi:hypothetical protein
MNTIPHPGRHMHPNVRLIAVLAVVAGAEVAVMAARSPGPGGAEVERIQAHLAGVEVALWQRDVSALEPAQREARAQLLDMLAEYRRAGRFPHNHVQAGLTPVFRDEHRSLCAVGYLIARSGRGDIVDAVAGRLNLGSIPDIATDSVLGPRLAQWLVDHGITLQEAAQIQPMYGEPPDQDPVSGHLVSSIVTGGLGIISGVVGVTSDHRSTRVVTGLLGIGSGAIQLGMAGHRVSDGGNLWALGHVDTVVGIANVMLGGLNLAMAGRSGGEPPPVQAAIEPGVDGTRIGLNVTF